MKPTQRTESLRNIRSQLPSFISIIVIAMLAASAYLGIIYSSKALRLHISQYYESCRHQNLQVVSPFLLTEGDLEAIGALDGVEDAEGVLATVGWVRFGDMREEINVISVSERISLPQLLSGRLPETAEECAVEKNLADALDLHEGDRISVENRYGGRAALLRGQEFTVCCSASRCLTGSCRNLSCICMQTTIALRKRKKASSYSRRRQWFSAR